MAWIAPVTDRVLADVTNKTAKGVANVVDFNRVENNTSELATLLYVTITTKTDWANTDIPTEVHQTRIVDNAQDCVDAYYVLPDTPNIPAVPVNTYTKWNALEQNLYDLYYMYVSNLPDLYLGEMYVGESIGTI